MTPLSVRTVERAVVYPTARVEGMPEKLFMGVYDGAGDYVDGTVLDRRSGTVGAPVPPGLFPLPDDGSGHDVVPEAIYAGTLYYHFGHFLLESLARVWHARQHPQVPLVWAGAHTWGARDLATWQRDVLRVLGVDNPVVVATGPTRVETLHVPDVGYRYDDWCHLEHAAFLACHEGPAQVAGQRLWLSRSGLRSDARDLSAVEAERRLAEAGWVVVHPETLQIHEQLDHLSRAEVIAGEEGSAFHLLVLLADLSGKRLQVLRRHGEEHRNMRTVGDARSIHQTFHTLEREHVVRASGRVVTKINPSSAETLDLLEVPVRPVGDAAVDPVVAHLVDRLAPARLLEAGPTVPALALTSSAGSRVAVSPRLDDDPRALEAAGVEPYELDLAQYADAFHGDRPGFDVIRIDRPDLASVMATFRASRKLGHDGTTWILGHGHLAARAALAVRALHPAFAARRVLVRRTLVHVVTRSRQPVGEAELAALSEREVARRAHLLPLTRLRRTAGRGSAGGSS